MSPAKLTHQKKYGFCSEDRFRRQKQQLRLFEHYISDSIQVQMVNDRRQATPSVLRVGLMLRVGSVQNNGILQSKWNFFFVVESRPSMFGILKFAPMPFLAYGFRFTVSYSIRFQPHACVVCTVVRTRILEQCKICIRNWYGQYCMTTTSVVRYACTVHSVLYRVESCSFLDTGSYIDYRYRCTRSRESF